MPFYGYNPMDPRPNPFYQPQPPQQPQYRAPGGIDHLTRDRYGTDVPTLWKEIRQLERKLQQRSEDVMECEREIKDLRHRHHKLRAAYEMLQRVHDRAMQLLDEERERRRRRPRRLY